MMAAKLSIVLVLLVQASTGLASGDFMLCFHRDGRIEVERFDLLCCKDAPPVKETCCPEEPVPGASTPCPDDACRDIPVSSASVQTSLERPAPTVEKSVEAALAIPDLSPAAFGEWGQAPSYLAPSAGPPILAGPAQHLRTIVLRI